MAVNQEGPIPTSHSASQLPNRSPVRPQVLGLPVALVVLIADQATKTWAVRSLVPGRPIPLFWTLQMNLTFNSGVAFGGISGAGIWVVPLALIVVAVVLYIGRNMTSRWGSIALGLIAGGAVGNITDRLLRDYDGAVVDFVDFQWWPIFNVADMAVVLGGILLVFSVMAGQEERHSHGDGTGESNPPGERYPS